METSPDTDPLPVEILDTHSKIVNNLASMTLPRGASESTVVTLVRNTIERSLKDNKSVICDFLRSSSNVEDDVLSSVGIQYEVIDHTNKGIYLFNYIIDGLNKDNFLVYTVIDKNVYSDTVH